MPSYRLPDANQLGNLLSTLLPVDVSAQVASGDTASRATAAYEIAQSGVVCVCQCDLAAANYLGSALTLFPPGGCQSNIESGEVPTEVLDNLKEIFNVCVNLFESDILPRPRLNGVSDTTEAGFDAANERVYKLKLDRYGEGLLRLASADVAAP